MYSLCSEHCNCWKSCTSVCCPPRICSLCIEYNRTYESQEAGSLVLEHGIANTQSIVMQNVYNKIVFKKT